MYECENIPVLPSGLEKTNETSFILEKKLSQ